MKRKQYIPHTILLLILAGHALCIAAQSSARELDDFLELSRQHKSATQLEMKLLENSTQHLLRMLEHYQNDSVPEIRTEVYRLAYKSGLKADNGTDRQAVVTFLAKNIQQETNGAIGLLANYLADFYTNDFTAESKYILGQLARKEVPYRARIIQLSGFLKIEETIYRYKKELAQGEVPFKTKWAMNLAMARMGDADALSYVVNKVRSVPVSDDLVYDLLPDLVYVRQKKAFDYLLELVDSDEKNCRSGNPSREAEILCAYRILAMVAPYIEEFPLKQHASGGLDTNNYPQALATAREWIHANKGSYTLIDNTY